MTRCPLFAGVFLLLGLAGCAQESFPPVPPPRAEIMGKPPVTETPLIWRPGHWNWTGAGYEWNPGMFVPRAGHGNLWMPGYWDRTAEGWRWIPAHWIS